MRVLAVVGCLLVALVEGIVLLTGRYSLLLPVAGGAAAFVIVTAALSARRPELTAPASAGLEREAVLRRWRDRTATLLSWSDGSRADWDQHLRPLLARDLARRHGAGGRERDRQAGLALLGPTLWPWVDPSDVDVTDRVTPAPGRDALAEMLRRLDPG